MQPQECFACLRCYALSMHDIWIFYMHIHNYVCVQMCYIILCLYILQLNCIIHTHIQCYYIYIIIIMILMSCIFSLHYSVNIM